jgi:hypothetical protein
MSGRSWALVRSSPLGFAPAPDSDDVELVCRAGCCNRSDMLEVIALNDIPGYLTHRVALARADGGKRRQAACLRAGHPSATQYVRRVGQSRTRPRRPESTKRRRSQTWHTARMRRRARSRLNDSPRVACSGRPTARSQGGSTFSDCAMVARAANESPAPPRQELHLVSRRLDLDNPDTHRPLRSSTMTSVLPAPLQVLLATRSTNTMAGGVVQPAGWLGG